MWPDTSAFTANAIWPIWANQTGTVITAATSTSATWISWITNSVTNVTSSTGTIETWAIWVDNCGQASITSLTQAQAYIPPVQTESERAWAAERQRAAQEKLKEEELQRKVAQAKAIELLHANLSQKQRKALEKHKWFLVEGGKSKKTYKIHGDRCAGNIIELEGDKEVARYCVHASYEIPLGDQLLAQMISLRLDEDHIISRANKTDLRRAA